MGWRHSLLRQAQAVLFGGGIALTGDENNSDCGRSIIAAVTEPTPWPSMPGMLTSSKISIQAVGLTAGNGQGAMAILGQQNPVC